MKLRDLSLSLLLMAVLTSSAVTAAASVQPLNVNNVLALAQPSYVKAPFRSNVTTTTQSSNQSSVSSNSTSTGSELNKKMADLSASDKPEDVATLAYIWGYPTHNNAKKF